MSVLHLPLDDAIAMIDAVGSRRKTSSRSC